MIIMKSQYRIVSGRTPEITPTHSHVAALLNLRILMQRRVVEAPRMQVSVDGGRTWHKANSRDGGVLNG